MIVEYLLLADGAKADINRHHLLGAGWDLLMANDPAYRLAQMAAAARVRFEEGDEEPVALSFDICDAEDRSVLPELLSARARCLQGDRGDGLPRRAYLTFTVADVNFPGPGTYHVVIRTDSSELGRETFEVRASRLLSESTDGDSDVTGTSPQPRAADTAQGQSEDEADDVRAWHPRS